MRRLVLVTILAAALSGCGDNAYRRESYLVLDRDTHDTIYLSGDQGAGSGNRALPLYGQYDGDLTGVGEDTYFFFAVEDDGRAYGFIHIGETTPGPEFEGQVLPDRSLVMEGDGVRIEGTFSGAYHPLSGQVYFSSGVLFAGTWSFTDGRSGPADAHHSIWPPGFHYVNYDVYDPLLDVLYNGVLY